MIRVLERHVKPALADHRIGQPVSVVDVGAYDVNGSYRGLFDHEGFFYRGVDVEAGPNVDIVMSDAARIPMETHSVDLVVSGQMLEHAPRFWEIFAEMARIVAPGGLLVVIAPSTGPEHRYPVDCYRFLPDSFRALGRAQGLEELDIFVNRFGPWNDLVGVFRQPGGGTADRETTGSGPGKSDQSGRFDNWFPGSIPAVPIEQWDTDEKDRVRKRGPRYLTALARLHRSVSPRGYLEIGVAAGNSLALAKCPAIGIDPAPRVGQRVFRDTALYEMTSDDYFDGHHDPGFPVDLAFIDGNHLFEFVLRDFINVEAVSNDNTVIVVDDITPGNPRHASRVRETTYWTGDVWKLALVLHHHRPELNLRFLNTSPAGMLVVTGANHRNTVLRDNYSRLVKDYIDLPRPPLNRLGRLVLGASSS